MTRLLVVTPFPPRRDATHGGGRATAELLLRLAARMPVALLHLAAPSEPPVDPDVADRCELVRRVERSPQWPGGVRGSLDRARAAVALVRGTPLWARELLVPELRRAVAETAREWRPDLAQIEYTVMGQYLAALPRELPTVLVVHEPAGVRARVWPGTTLRDRLAAALDRRAWERYEPRLLAGADAVVVFTRDDGSTLTRRAELRHLHTIPLGLDAAVPALDPAGAPDEVVFVGSFIHPPNVDAARFLVQEILPLVRERHPRATVSIVGMSPPESVLELAEEDGVVVRGSVPDVRPYLDRAAVVVAPIREGGGMRVKVLETLAAGKALVATPLAVSGIAVEDSVHALLRDEAHGLAEAIATLLQDEAKRLELAANARRWAAAQPGWDAVCDEYERLYASLLRPG